MKQVTSGDFGDKRSINLPVVATPLLGRINYNTKRGVMGNLPRDYSGKSYMVFGRYSDEILEDYGQTFGWGFKFKAPKITINVKKFVNSLGKAFESIVDAVKETMAVARKMVLAVTPPALHGYIDIVINPIPLITHPASTIKKLTNPAPLLELIKNPQSQIEAVLDPQSKLDVFNYAYKNVLKPLYKSSMDVTATFVLAPISDCLDETVYKVLPSSLTQKLEKLTDMPEQAARGKLTSGVLLEACKAYWELANLPAAVAGYVGNGIIDWARKDAILGTVINGLDKYSGGLITMAQDLANTGQEVYYERDIDWKKKVIEAIMVYLAVVSCGTFAAAMAAMYVGNQTGLSKTQIGRDILLAGRIYLTSGASLGSDAAYEAGKAVLTETMKREIITKAATMGIIDRKTLQDLVTYGQAAGLGPDGKVTGDKLIDVSKDAVYQEFVREEIKRMTGLDMSLKNIMEVYAYASDPQLILDNVDKAIEKAKTDRDMWESNVEKAYEKAIEDYENFNLGEFIAQEMPRFEQNVKDELTRYADGHVDDFVKWAISQLGPDKARNPASFTPELLTQYETSVLDLTGQPVPKKVVKKLNPMVFGAGVAIMAGAAFLISED